MRCTLAIHWCAPNVTLGGALLSSNLFIPSPSTPRPQAPWLASFARSGGDLVPPGGQIGRAEVGGQGIGGAGNKVASLS